MLHGEIVLARSCLRPKLDPACALLRHLRQLEA